MALLGLSLPAETLARYRAHPDAFVREQFGAEPEIWQLKALKYLAWDGDGPPWGVKKRLAMQACADVGKSALEAWWGWLFLTCYAIEGHYPQAIALSMSRDNLESGLWKEMAFWRGKSALLQHQFRQTASQIYHHDDRFREAWWIKARAYSKDANPEEQGAALSGLHSRFQGYLLDETGGQPVIVGKRSEQGMGRADGYAFIVQAGNPFDEASLLGESVRDSRYHVIEITADPDDPDRCTRVDADHARHAIESAEDGREDPWVMAYILGKFPRRAINQLLTREQVETAMKRVYRPEQYESQAMILGVDVARGGLDESAQAARQGLRAYDIMTARIEDSVRGGSWVAENWNKRNADACFVDNTGGYGGGWIDQLRVLGFAPIGVEYAGHDQDRRFANKRSAMWWRMAEWIKGGGALPEDKRLLAELIEPRYAYQRDRLILEPKEKVKDRLRRSPDRADALAQTFASPVAPRSLEPTYPGHGPYAVGRQKVKWNNPWEDL